MAAAALVVGSLLAAVVWHFVWLDAVDAWVLQWQNRAYAHGATGVFVVAVARLVETVHSLTDVVGGAGTGLVVTLGAALAITAWARHDRRRPTLVAPSRSGTA